jgi:hypothetical protein
MKLVFDKNKKIEPIAAFPSQRAYEDSILKAYRDRGIEPVRATYDAAGNCTICGECGRCPGWHMPPPAIQTNNTMPVLICPSCQGVGAMTGMTYSREQIIITFSCGHAARYKLQEVIEHGAD